MVLTGKIWLFLNSLSTSLCAAFAQGIAAALPNGIPPGRFFFLDSPYSDALGYAAYFYTSMTMMLDENEQHSDVVLEACQSPYFAASRYHVSWCYTGSAAAELKKKKKIMSSHDHKVHYLLIYEANAHLPYLTHTKGITSITQRTIRQRISTLSLATWLFGILLA